VLLKKARPFEDLGCLWVIVVAGGRMNRQLATPRSAGTTIAPAE